MGLTTDVGDRIHLINQTIKGVSAFRFMPQSFDMTPLIVPLVGAEQNRHRAAGALMFSGERMWTLFCVVGTWMQGLPTESASREGERLLDAITECYIPRLKLEYDGRSLDWVDSAELGSDDGIFQFAEDYAALRFPLTVTTRRIYTINTSR